MKDFFYIALIHYKHTKKSRIGLVNFNWNHFLYQFPFTMYVSTCGLQYKGNSEEIYKYLD
jgi:hypothetical protein